MMNIEGTIQEYKEGLGRFTEKMSDIGHKYMEFTAACFAPGKIAEKEKQLIALGISVFANDEYCIVYHTNAAVALGATETEVLECVGVSAAFGGGAAISQGVTLVQDCLSQINNKTH